VLRLRQSGVEWKEIEGEIVALEGETSTYLSANASGALIWRSLATGATREQLADQLVDRYGITSEVARADVDRFLAELSERGLLE
jgi:hypothetical protein